MGEATDADLMLASVDEPSSFAGIFDRHGATLLRYLISRVGPNDAEGLLGDVFRIAFERRRNFDCERDSALPWLYGIAANLLRRHHRSQARRLRAVARLRTTTAEPAEAEAVEAAADAAVLLPKVIDALTSLTAPDRETLLLYAWDNLGYEEIAVILGIPSGTVRSRINRARARLREHLGMSGEEPHETGGAQ